MTSFFMKKIRLVTRYDSNVIVDNSVETGDFSSGVDYLVKK